MLAGLEAVLTEVKVITVSAFEPGAVYGKHLATVTPADAVKCVKIQKLRVEDNSEHLYFQT